MTLRKKISDHFKKMCDGKDYVPRGLMEINRYFRFYGPIRFEYKQESGTTIAISQNFKYGSIVTYGKDRKELEKNIRDAIITSFDIPSSYAKEAAIKEVGKNKEKVYALA